MFGIIENFIHITCLDNFPAIHYRDSLATLATTPKSWVIKMIAVPSFLATLALTLKFALEWLRPMLLLVHPQLRIFGLHAKAIAIIAR